MTVSISNEGANWFVLRVKPNHERRVFDLAGYMGYNAFLPVYRVRRKWGQRWHDIDAPLFPSYVFCQFSRQDWVPIINTPGVVDVVRNGKSLLPVEPSEIQALQIAQHADLAMEPWPYMPIGCELKINAGPLAGLTGLLVEAKQRKRLLLSVTLLQRSVLVEIDRAWVHVVDPNPAYLRDQTSHPTLLA
jgi:transcription antitermination factor NusG